MPSIGIGIGIALRTTTLSPGFVNPFSGAAIAYSLRIPGGSSYSGPLIRVRRSSDNSEQDISAASSIDAYGNKTLDTSALLSFSGAGSAFVVTWYDQTGNSRHITNATAAQQPRIVNAGTVDTKNSKPTLVFSGGQKLANSSMPTGVSSITANLVAQYTANASINVLIDNDHDSGLGWVAQYRGDLANKPLESAHIPVVGGVPTYLNPAGSLLINTLMYTSSVNDKIFINGTLQSTGVNTSVCTSRSVLALGDWSGGVRRYLTGFISEVSIFTSALNDTDRGAAENNQKTFFGIV